MGEFLKYMDQQNPKLAPKLIKLIPNTPGFDAEWKRVATAQVIFHFFYFFNSYLLFICSQKHLARYSTVL